MVLTHASVKPQTVSVDVGMRSRIEVTTLGDIHVWQFETGNVTRVTPCLAHRPTIYDTNAICLM